MVAVVVVLLLAPCGLPFAELLVGSAEHSAKSAELFALALSFLALASLKPVQVSLGMPSSNFLFLGCLL